MARGRAGPGSGVAVRRSCFDPDMSNGWQMPWQAPCAAGEWGDSTGRAQVCGLPPLLAKPQVRGPSLHERGAASSWPSGQNCGREVSDGPSEGERRRDLARSGATTETQFRPRRRHRRGPKPEDRGPRHRDKSQTVQVSVARIRFAEVEVFPDHSRDIVLCHDHRLLSRLHPGRPQFLDLEDGMADPRGSVGRRSCQAGRADAGRPRGPWRPSRVTHRPPSLLRSAHRRGPAHHRTRTNFANVPLLEG